MKMMLLLLLPMSLFCEHIDKAILSKSNKKAMKNPKIECRWVCDEKAYQEKKIAEAISFYKNSKYYKFTKKLF